MQEITAVNVLGGETNVNVDEFLLRTKSIYIYIYIYIYSDLSNVYSQTIKSTVLSILFLYLVVTNPHDDEYHDDKC